MEKTKSKPRPKGKKKYPKGTQTKGYRAESNAICIVMYDKGGIPVNDKIANEALDAVTEIAVKYGFLISYTRQ